MLMVRGYERVGQGDVEPDGLWVLWGSIGMLCLCSMGVETCERSLWIRNG